MSVLRKISYGFIVGIGALAISNLWGFGFALVFIGLVYLLKE